MWKKQTVEKRENKCLSYTCLVSAPIQNAQPNMCHVELFQLRWNTKDTVTRKFKDQKWKYDLLYLGCVCTCLFFL